MVCLVTDQRPGEPNIISGHEMKPLQVKSLSDVLLLVLEPTQDNPWTDENLRNLPLDSMVGEKALNDGVNVYLGGHWIGSTEV